MLDHIVSNIKDVRYHNYSHGIADETYVWDTDWTHFAGLQGMLPMERWVYEHSYAMVRASNVYWYVSIYLSIAYIVTIFGLKMLMARREKGFDLRRELIAWNTFLALFSLVGTVRCLPEFIATLSRLGFQGSYVQNTYVEDIRVNAWYLFFTLSKAFELVDTLFIVFRKRKLINLHWIHHTLTLIYSWFVFGDMPSTARWMVNMNLVIHTFMYGYYALAALRVRIPRQVNITLTTAQILQMFFGLYINYDCLKRKLLGQPCDISLSVAVSGFSLYFLFFLLFVNFFIRTYIVPNSGKVVKAAVQGGKSILGDFNNNANGEQCGQMAKKLQ